MAEDIISPDEDKRGKLPSLPDAAENGNAVDHAQKVQKKWDAEAPTDGSALTIIVPKANASIQFERLETEGNVVRVWTNGNSTEDPDYVIVNPPTHVEVSEYSKETIEDPLSAIAEAIHGASI